MSNKDQIDIAYERRVPWYYLVIPHIHADICMIMHLVMYKQSIQLIHALGNSMGITVNPLGR